MKNLFLVAELNKNPETTKRFRDFFHINFIFLYQLRQEAGDDQHHDAADEHGDGLL